MAPSGAVFVCVDGLLLADSCRSSDLAWNDGLRVSCRPIRDVRLSVKNSWLIQLDISYSA